MSLFFRNTTGRRLYTAFAVYEPSACSSFGEYLVKQWFWIEPDGLDKPVYAGPVRGSRYWAYGHDGMGHHWGGGQAVCLSNEAATFCVGSRACLNPTMMAVIPTNGNPNQILNFF